MALTQAQLNTARRIAHEIPDIDSDLPGWARRNNPIVRRQLREYWRVFPPELEPILTWLGIQAAMLVVSIQFPLIFMLAMIALLVAAALLPVMLLWYAQTLFEMIRDSTESMAQEYEKGRLDLLRATPYTAREIILSKIAATVWRRMDTLAVITAFTLTLGASVIVGMYLNSYSPEDWQFIPQILSLVALIAAVLRLPLEMFMVSVIGIYVGATMRSRQSALIGTGIIVLFYFLLVNLLRLIHLSWPLRMTVDSILPVLLPILISGLCLRGAVKTLEAS